MRIVVLERHSVGPDIPVRYEHLGEVTYYRNTTTVKEVRERVRDADIIVANKAPLREETLKEARGLRLICELATGFDNVDLAYCKSRGIKVCNVVDYCSGMVAQHTFALALALLEKLPHYDGYVKSGAYSAQDRFSNFDLPFHELEGMTWGIIGMGNIGRRVAGIAAAFGCRVIFHSVTGTSTCRDYPQVDKAALLAESDILSLHCPLSDLTRGETAPAGLDVVDGEPLRPSNPLSGIKDSDRLIITPHLAWASVEARTRCVEEVAKNIEAFQRGEPRNIVNP